MSYLFFGGILEFCIPCIMASVVIRIWPSQKLQSSVALGRTHSWLFVAAVSVGNIFILGVPFYIYTLQRTIREQNGDWKTILFQLFGLVLFLELWFYTTHRILHHRFFFRHIHQLHHTVTSPRPYSVAFAHPLEYIFHNLGGGLLLPLVVRIDDRLFVLWCITCLAVATCSHSGIRILGARAHDRHQFWCAWYR